jgi:hypothetical protein
MDTTARSNLAEAVRALVAGRITNDEFEDRVPRSADPAVDAVFLTGIWPLYSDLYRHRLVGSHKLSPDARRLAARCVLFLKSRQPYAWPLLGGLATIGVALLNLLTIGIFGAYVRQQFASHGDIEVWPFHSRSEYVRACLSPPYLHGSMPN